MDATIDQKARLLDLITEVLELVRNGERDAHKVCEVLQVIEEEPDFASILGRDQQVLFIIPKIFRTINLGTGLRTADDFQGALENAGCSVSEGASEILRNPAFMIAGEEATINLVSVSASELGLKKRASREDVYNQALRLGLELCPIEVGPQLRLQYRKDQPAGEVLFIGMDAIIDSDGIPNLFRVERKDGSLQLVADQGSSVDLTGSRWVFIWPK